MTADRTENDQNLLCLFGGFVLRRAISRLSGMLRREFGVPPSYLTVDLLHRNEPWHRASIGLASSGGGS